MSLTDVMSAANLAAWAEIALVIFFVAFGAIVVHTLLRPRAALERESRVVLDDAAESSSTPAHGLPTRQEERDP